MLTANRTLSRNADADSSSDWKVPLVDSATFFAISVFSISGLIEDRGGRRICRIPVVAGDEALPGAL